MGDFEALIKSTFGLNKFSMFQIKAVFKMYAKDADVDITKGYIPIVDFKDYFYPHKNWKADYNKGKTKEDYLKQRKLDDSDDDNMSNKSAMIDDIMQGKAVDDVMKQRATQEVGA